MAPIKSSLAKSAKKLFGIFGTADLGLRGRGNDTSRLIPPTPKEYWEFKVWGAGGGGGTCGAAAAPRPPSSASPAPPVGLEA